MSEPQPRTSSTGIPLRANMQPVGGPRNPPKNTAPARAVKSTKARESPEHKIRKIKERFDALFCLFEHAVAHRFYAPRRFPPRPNRPRRVPGLRRGRGSVMTNRILDGVYDDTEIDGYDGGYRSENYYDDRAHPAPYRRDRRTRDVLESRSRAYDTERSDERSFGFASDLETFYAQAAAFRYSPSMAARAARGELNTRPRASLRGGSDRANEDAEDDDGEDEVMEDDDDFEEGWSRADGTPAVLE